MAAALQGKYAGCHMAKEQGLTLLELLIALAVAAVLASLAAPNFNSFIQHNRAAAQVNTLAGTLNYARSTAITRNRAVTLCRSADGHQCNHQLEWNAGWIVFENLSGRSPPRVSAGDTVLWSHEPLPPGSRILANRDTFTFHPIGTRSVNGTLLYCSANGRHDRALIVSVMGRVRVADKPNSDTSLKCP